MAEGDSTPAWRKRLRATGEKVRSGALKLDSNAKLVTAAKLIREMAPGDSRFGDQLSTAGEESPQVLARRMSKLTEKRPGLLHEAGMTTLQMWQAVSESQGRGRGSEQLAIVFTDLADFSDWALEVGDDQALELLRDVGEAIEQPVNANGGRVVKRLGDGMMAVFSDTGAALDAVTAGRDRLKQVECDGYEPRIRAGIHFGKPRKIGGDYLGVDVNIAARLAENASADEVLMSETAIAKLDRDDLQVKKKRRFSVKGVPKDMTAHSVR
jgi:class 3 adenylate cyclase